MKTIREAKVLYILCSSLMAAAGLFLILRPDTSASLLCIVAGAFLVLFGACKIFGYFTYDAYQLAFQFDLALGIFSALLGVVLLVHPGRVLSIVSILLGLFVLVDGVFKLQTAGDARRFGLPHWWLILVGGILCIAAGAFLIFDPFDGGRLMMITVGVSLLIDGIQNLFNALYTVRILHRLKNGR